MYNILLKNKKVTKQNIKSTINFQKRSMFSCVTAACIQAREAFARSFSSRPIWSVVTRDAIKGSPAVKPQDLETHVSGFKILNDFDYSGKSHKILVDKNDNSIPGFYKAFGVWTTSPHGFIIKPIDTGCSAIDGQSNERQYFIPYNTTYLVRRNVVEEDLVSTMFVYSDEYAAFIEELKKRYQLT